MNASTLVQKLWNYCNILRDDGAETIETLQAALDQLKELETDLRPAPNS
jgi:hypothetical protein